MTTTRRHAPTWSPTSRRSSTRKPSRSASTACWRATRPSPPLRQQTPRRRRAPLQPSETAARKESRTRPTVVHRGRGNGHRRHQLLGIKTGGGQGHHPPHRGEDTKRHDGKTFEDEIPDDTQTLIITVINTPPRFTEMDPAREVAENVPLGTNVGTPLEVQNLEGDTLVWEISGSDFTVDESGQDELVRWPSLIAVVMDVPDAIEPSYEADAEHQRVLRRLPGHQHPPIARITVETGCPDSGSRWSKQPRPPSSRPDRAGRRQRPGQTARGPGSRPRR